jgi:hypothetical protein
MLTALSKAEGLRSASSFVTAPYFYVRLIPQDLRALHLDLARLASGSFFFAVVFRVCTMTSRLASAVFKSFKERCNWCDICLKPGFCFFMSLSFRNLS